MKQSYVQIKEDYSTWTNLPHKHTPIDRITTYQIKFQSPYVKANRTSLLFAEIVWSYIIFLNTP